MKGKEIVLLLFAALLFGCLQPQPAKEQERPFNQEEFLASLLLSLNTSLPNTTVQTIDLGLVDTGNIELPDRVFSDIKLNTNVTPSYSVNLTDQSFLANATDFSKIKLDPSSFYNTSSSKPSAEICKQFESAPDCSYVPAQYQEMCRQCKAK